MGWAASITDNAQAGGVLMNQHLRSLFRPLNALFAEQSCPSVTFAATVQIPNATSTAPTTSAVRWPIMILDAARLLPG
jgi:hypothetical protein